MSAAEHAACLVLSVDVPLVPLSALERLCQAHAEDVTILCHGGIREPLIGVYDRRVAAAILPLIRTGSAPVRVLESSVPLHCWDYDGPEELLRNCNTPEDFALIQKSVGASYMDPVNRCFQAVGPKGGCLWSAASPLRTQSDAGNGMAFRS